MPTPSGSWSIIKLVVNLIIEINIKLLMSEEAANTTTKPEEKVDPEPKKEEKPLTEEEIAEKNKKRAERLAIIMGPAKEQQHKTIGNYTVGKKTFITFSTDTL
jgi:hypothetical protein